MGSRKENHVGLLQTRELSGPSAHHKASLEKALHLIRSMYFVFGFWDGWFSLELNGYRTLNTSFCVRSAIYFLGAIGGYSLLTCPPSTTHGAPADKQRRRRLSFYDDGAEALVSKAPVSKQFPANGSEGVQRL